MVSYLNKDKLLQKIKSNVRKYNLFLPNENIVIAASAGVDSQNLLNFISKIHPINQVLVVHVNHDLRKSAMVEADFVKEVSQKYGFKYKQFIWENKNHPKNGVELAAREYRYLVLNQMAKEFKATKILTAHHANDLTETFLMKMIRGGRWQQLSGIEWKRHLNQEVDVIRPLLNIKKQTLIDYAKVNNINWYEDESNQDLKFTRNRIRNVLIPNLIKENPQVIEHINNYAHELSDLKKLVNQQASEYLTLAIQNQNWNLVPKMWFEETIKLYLQKEVPMLSVKQKQLLQIQQLFKNKQKPNGKIVLNNEWIIIKKYQNLILVKNNQDKQISSIKNKEYVITLYKWYLLNNGGKFIVKPKKDLENNLSKGMIIPLVLEPKQLPLHIRTRKIGDVIKLKNGHQKIKKIMIDAKIPIDKRDNVPLLVDNCGQVLWIVGYKHAWFESKAVNYEVVYFKE